MTSTNRSPDEWRELIRQHASSGQSIKAFCERHGVVVSAFYYWRRRLADEPGTVPSTALAVSFVAVEEVSLDADAFAAFEETGDIFDPATAKKLRDNIYSAGGSRDPEAAYIAFRGRLPTPDAMLKRRGLVDAPASGA